LSIDGGPNSGGFGFGYNFNENLNVNTSFIFGSTDIEIKNLSGGMIGEGDTDFFLSNVNLDYNIMKDSFTPFVTGGIGYVKYDGNLKYNGNPNSESIDSSDFSWNLGAGLRWDVSEKWLLKATYATNWTELDDADDTSRFWSVSLSLGYKF